MAEQGGVAVFSGRGGGWLLAVAAVGCAAGVGAASLRHTGSLAFPIDDAYIYGNYVLAAAQGQGFTYNAGETSGGITSLGWYALCTLCYALLAPFHLLLGGLGPPLPGVEGEVARQAGRLYLAAYLPGVLCLVATALGVRRLAQLALPEGRNPVARSAFAWLLGVVAAGDLGLVWGAMSGLEVALSSAVGVWAVALLGEEASKGRLRWSLLLAAGLAGARPDLLSVAVAGVAWLLVRGLWVGWRKALLDGALYAGAAVAGVAAMALAYLVGWGRPLPSSFYAKAGGVRLGRRFFSAAEELVIAGRYLPFVAGGLALAGSMVAIVGRNREREGRAPRWAEMPSLLLLASGFYVAGIMATLPWFGQEDRYLLPVHPLVIVQVGMLAWWFLRYLPLDGAVARRGICIAAAAAMAALVIANYGWATRNYAVQVRNIADAHIRPALWLAEQTPPGSVVAAEPIGAVKLFSGRRTVDLVGLTTPATLGTYGNWEVAGERLRAEGADYLLFYPAWFDSAGPPSWAVERARFEIPDNRIAGDAVIAVYELDWARLEER